MANGRAHIQTQAHLAPESVSLTSGDSCPQAQRITAYAQLPDEEAEVHLIVRRTFTECLLCASSMHGAVDPAVTQAQPYLGPDLGQGWM